MLLVANSFPGIPRNSEVRMQRAETAEACDVLICAETRMEGIGDRLVQSTMFANGCIERVCTCEVRGGYMDGESGRRNVSLSV